MLLVKLGSSVGPDAALPAPMNLEGRPGGRGGGMKLLLGVATGVESRSSDFLFSFSRRA